MVQKYFHKANISLNKLLQWNDLVKKCTVVKLGGHKLVQHVCSIGNSRLIRPKHPPHVAPTYDPNSLKSLVFLTNWLFTHLTMDNSKMLWYEKISVIIISWVHVFEKMEKEFILQSCHWFYAKNMTCVMFAFDLWRNGLRNVYFLIASIEK